jgi:hypothetical protein
MNCRNQRLTAFLAAWTVLCLLSGTAAGGSLGETVKDKEHGISFRAPKEWVSIPVDPLEVITIHKFQANRSDRAKKIRGVSFTAALEVLFFPSLFDERAEEPEGREPIDAYRVPKYKNYAHFLKKQFKTYFEGERRESGPQKILATHHDFTFNHKTPGGREIPLRLRAAVFHAEEGDFAMHFVCMDEHYDTRHRKDIESSIRTFGRLKKRELNHRSMAGLNANQQYIQAQIEKLSSGWYYFWSRRKNYVIYSNADRSFSRKISQYLEKMHAIFEKEFEGEPRVSWIPIVRVCKTRNEYLGYGGMEGTAGYWWDLTREFVFYKDVARGEKRSMQTLRHEALHHYLHFFLGTAPAVWLDEGFACYFEGCEASAGRLKVKPSLSRRDAIQKVLIADQFIPLKDFVKMSHKAFMKQPQLTYPEAWSLVYFLREGKREGVRMEPRWERLIPDYLDHLTSALEELERIHPDRKAGDDQVNLLLGDKTRELAWERTFGDWTDKDWQRFEEAWIEFYR